MLQRSSTIAVCAGASSRCHASLIALKQGAAFQCRHDVKPINPTLLFALYALALPEILSQISVVMQGNRLGEIEPKPLGRGPAASARPPPEKRGG
jgi:hypothetical protein